MVEESGSKSNYLFVLIKFVLFLIIFCFLVEITKEFWRQIRSKEDFDLAVFILSLVSCFGFYTLAADLNGVYKRIQNFFFRSSFLALVFPSLLILSGLGFFLLPKVFQFTYNREVFLFSGGFLLTMHLVFIARETKGHNFASVINYLFTFSILYILNLMIFSLYLGISYPMQMRSFILQGARQGAALIQAIFTQALRGG